jgi:predicted extracellular nuclease/methionine-rich copper-binding protein CopC
MTTVYHALSASNFSQNWTNVATAIPTADSWSGVASIVGYRGDSLSAAAGTDPQTVTADGSATPQSAVLLGSTPSGSGAVGVFQTLADPVVALQGSGTADAPHLVLHLDATGRENIQISYRLRDLDSNTDNAVQAVALQYRLDETGPFINVPAAFTADASDGPSLTKETTVNATLPAAVNGAAKLQLRIITNDAVGADEWIGIDDISVTSSAAAPVGPSLAYSGSINESQAFDGQLAAGSKITITLSGETFTGTDGASLLSSANVTNVPAGLTAVLTRTSATTAELSFSGTAASHANANDVNNLTVTFADGAFTGGSAAGVANSTQSSLKINFADLGTAGSGQTFTPNTGTTLGSSDASTALALDANWMVVGDDEVSVLRVYDRAGGQAVKEWNYGTALGNGGELDLEGGTRIGDTFYFTGSHSNNKSGAEQNNREYILAVKITGTGADTQFTYLGKHTSLEDQLVAWDQGNVHGKGANYFGFATSSGAGVIPENLNGFSIEGMTASQDGTKLLVGFRAPQTDANTRDKAVVLALDVAGLVSETGGAAPNVSGVYELNLGGRGIRSIEKAGDGSYLILAGPSGSASAEVTHDFRLFRWDGVSATPAELDVNLDALRDGTGGSFETIVDVQSTAQGTLLQLLQDNGDSTWGGATASKDLPAAQQKFVGNWVQIGANVTDATGPVLKTSTPADDATNVDKAANLVLRFDEGVARGTGDFVIKKVSDNSTVATISAADTTQVTVAFNTVTINPTADLAANTAYYVEAVAGTLNDHYGNNWGGLAGATAFNFTTTSAPPPKVLITEVNSSTSSGAGGGDFFELYNYGTTAIDLSGWKWTDEVGVFSSATELTAGTMLAAGERLIVVNTTNEAAFRTAWNNLPSTTKVLAVGGAGLGGDDAVVVFDSAGKVAAAVNYKATGTSITASDNTVIQPLVKTGGGNSAGGHSGVAVGGAAGTSAVWDGVSTSNPQYTAAVANVNGAFAQTGTPANIGSPGAIPKPKVLITEVNSSTSSGAGGGDFFELYNYGSTAIDLSGWKWTDEAGVFSSATALSAGTVLAAGEKLIIVNATDEAAFRTAWNNLPTTTKVLAVGGAGLGGDDAVVVFDATGSVAAAINYKATGTSVTASDGTVIQPLVKTGGGNSAGGHTGVAVGGAAGTSAVWDGISTVTPQYKAAVAGQDGAFAQTGTPANIGSPGLTEAAKGAVPTYTQAFNDANGFAEFTKYSKDADAANSWYLNTTAGADKAAEVNGFGDTAAANDWLISKAFNLNDTSAEFLSFRTWTNFTDSGFAQPVTLKYSTNYSGTGDPTLATWTDLGFTPSAQGSQAWTQSGPIDLSAIAGTNVYFAFQYQSSGTAASSSSSWRVDDFKLESYSGSVVSIAATSADKLEGNTGTTAYTFTVTRAGDTSAAASINWAVTGSGTSPATADDFVGNALPTGLVSFAAGETSKLITVNVQGDATIEQDEGFTVTLSGLPNGVTAIGGGTAQGIIRTDEAPITKVHAIQGSSDTAQMMGSTVTIEGIVTGWAPNLQGFYVQEEAADYDSDASTSEGIFVYYGSTVIPGLDANSVGDKISVKGTVADYKGQTQLASPTAFTLVQDNAGLPAATVVTLPVASAINWEAYEGMLVTVQSATNGGKLVVTDNFNLGQYGQVTLTSDAIQQQYTELNAPSVSGNTAYLADLKKDQIILDDLSSTQNPASHIGRGGLPLSATNTLRAGDGVTSVTGIVDQFVDTAAATHETSYRVQPTQAVNFTGDARPTAGSIPGSISSAEIKVASANVLNYFTTLGTANFITNEGNSIAARGATDATEFQRQQAKIVKNLLSLDADVLGLMEVQNNGFGPNSAIQSLVNALNAEAGPGTYAFVEQPKTGSDAIMVAIIYKTAKVELVGAASNPDPAVYDAFSSTYGNRIPVAQTFKSKADGETFTLVVNHFKSKGSGTATQGLDTGDGQGASTIAREKAAAQLAQWLGTHPTGSTDNDVLLVGDFNAYSKEKTITDLAASGYSKVSTGNSYAFDGLWGSLDHALASSSLTSQVAGSYKWGINAEEPTLLDYNMENKDNAQDASYFNADPYRSSDHNPILIGLNLGSTPASGGGGGGGGGTPPTIPLIPSAGPGLPATLQGSSSSDTIVVPDLPLTRVVTGGGADTVTGGKGVDTVVVSATLADVLRLGISQDSTGKVVINTPTGPVTMSGVERVELQGSLFAFDVALPTATSDGGKTGQVLALAYTLFGQKPDTLALSQWVHKADSLGGLDALAQNLIDTLAPGIGNDGLVGFLFKAVTGVDATAQQVLEFASLIGPGKSYATQGAFLAAVTKLPIATEGLAELVGVVQQLDAGAFPV